MRPEGVKRRGLLRRREANIRQSWISAVERGGGWVEGRFEIPSSDDFKWMRRALRVFHFFLSFIGYMRYEGDDGGA